VSCGHLCIALQWAKTRPLNDTCTVRFSLRLELNESNRTVSMAPSRR
jgi:hypothetical protein